MIFSKICEMRIFEMRDRILIGLYFSFLFHEPRLNTAAMSADLKKSPNFDEFAASLN